MGTFVQSVTIVDNSNIFFDSVIFFVSLPVTGFKDWYHPGGLANDGETQIIIVKPRGSHERVHTVILA